MKAKRSILDILFPIECFGCGIEFEDLEPKERWICPDCLKKIAIRKLQTCPACEEYSEGGKTHHRCKGKTAVDGVWVSAEYSSKVISEAIKKMKFNFIKDISFPLALVMARSVLEVDEFSDFHDILMSNLSKEREEGIYLEEDRNKNCETLVVPVPLHKKRYKWRGFNQAFLLSEHVCARFDLKLDDKLLERRKNTKSQSNIGSMDERKENMKDAFFCPDQCGISRKNIILIDDVCTTLTTMDECAKVLKKAGASHVWGFVAARR